MEYKLTFDAFQEGLKEDKLLGLRCNKCGAYTVPPKKVCMECTSEDLDIVELGGKGEVQTFTVVRVAPEGFEPPYVVALVKLDEGPWVMGSIPELEADKATMDLVGKRVKLGHRIFPGDKFSGGEQVAIAFSLEA